MECNESVCMWVSMNWTNSTYTKQPNYKDRYILLTLQFCIITCCLWKVFFQRNALATCFLICGPVLRSHLLVNRLFWGPHMQLMRHCSNCLTLMVCTKKVLLWLVTLRKGCMKPKLAFDYSTGHLHMWKPLLSVVGWLLEGGSEHH